MTRTNKIFSKLVVLLFTVMAIIGVGVNAYAAPSLSLSVTSNESGRYPGSILTASVGDDAKEHVDYQWRVSNSAMRPGNGYSGTSTVSTMINNSTPIEGETGSTYTVRGEDVGRYVYCLVTGTDDYTGAQAISHYDSAVQIRSISVNVSSDEGGYWYPGSVLTAAVTSGAEEFVSYQWRVSDSGAGYRDTTDDIIAKSTAIAGETGSTYTIRGEDVGKYIYCIATGTDKYAGAKSYSPGYGNATITARPLSVRLSSFHTANPNSINSYYKGPTPGDIYYASAGTSEEYVVYQWYQTSSTQSSAADVIANGVKVGKTGSKYYTIQESDIDKYIYVVASGKGKFSGSTAYVVCQWTDIYGGVNSKVNNDRYASLSGKEAVGSTLTVTPVGITADSYQWQRVAFVYSGSGYTESITDIAGATNSTYTVQEEDEGYILRVKVNNIVTANTSGPIGDGVELVSVHFDTTNMSHGTTLTAVVEPSNAKVGYTWYSEHDLHGEACGLDAIHAASNVNQGKTFDIDYSTEGNSIKVIAWKLSDSSQKVEFTYHVEDENPWLESSDSLWYYRTYEDGIEIQASENQTANEALEIPSSVDGHIVRKIAKRAFASTWYSFNGGTSAESKPTTYVASLPDTLKVIGDYPKFGSDASEGLVIPEGVEYVGPFDNRYWSQASMNSGGVSLVEPTVSLMTFMGHDTIAPTLAGANPPIKMYKGYIGSKAWYAAGGTDAISAASIAIPNRFIPMGYGVVITGTRKPSYQLSADLSYEGATISGVSGTYQWSISETEDGVYTDIDGATARTYVIKSEDMDKYLKVTFTDASGEQVTTTTLLSAKKKLTGISVDAGEYVGEDISVDITPADATVTYQWQISSDGVSYTNISGETSASYTLKPGDVNRRVRVVITGIDDYEGSNYTSTGVLVKEVEYEVEVTGKAVIHQTLEATVYANGEEDDTFTFEWLESDTEDGDFTKVGSTASYTLAKKDIGKYIKVVGHNTDGSVTVDSTPVLVIGEVYGIGIKGIARVNNTLEAIVDPEDATGTYQWYLAADGVNFEKIPGATNKTYSIKKSDAGKWIQVTFTGTDGYQGIVATVQAGSNRTPSTGTTPGKNGTLAATDTPSDEVEEPSYDVVISVTDPVTGVIVSRPGIMPVAPTPGKSPSEQASEGEHVIDPDTDGVSVGGVIKVPEVPAGSTDVVKHLEVWNDVTGEWEEVDDFEEDEDGNIIISEKYRGKKVRVKVTGNNAGGNSFVFSTTAVYVPSSDDPTNPYTSDAMVRSVQSYTDEELDIWTAAAQKDVQVYASQSSMFTVRIPKKIALDGETGVGTFAVTVAGDIPGDQTIRVVPDSSLELYTTGKEPITADVEIEKTGWSIAEDTQAGLFAGTDATGTITAHNLTSGLWSGIFSFKIDMEGQNYESTIALTKEFNTAAQ